MHIAMAVSVCFGAARCPISDALFEHVQVLIRAGGIADADMLRNVDIDLAEWVASTGVSPGFE